MAKNVYFSGGTTSEQRLVEDLIIESLKIYGHDVYYLPREIVKEDDLFTEDVLSRFDENYMIEMYISNYEGFEGDGSLLTKFGVRIADEATFIVAKRRWEDLISSSNNLVSNFRPNEGDVIYLPLTEQLFQIKFVEHEKPFRQLDAIQTYGLVAELMEYSGERLETGVEEIDKITREIGYTQVLHLLDGGTGNFEFHELVTSTAKTATATATLTLDSVGSVTVTKNGSGYTTTPLVKFSAPQATGGTQATGNATLVSDRVVNITVTNPGSGYTSAPTVTLDYSPEETNAKVTRFDTTNKELELIDIDGKFTDGDTIVGLTSGAAWTINTFSSIENENDPEAENDYFEVEADKILDWTETNPFGEYGDMGVF